MNKILVLWGIPRSRSTAFERMILERKDFHIIHEPFGPHYYFSDERVKNRAHDIEPQPKYRFDNVLQRILQAAEKHNVFVKDLAFYVAHRADEAFMSHFENTFIIRHPAQKLPSHYMVEPDFDIHEAGYLGAYKLFELAKAVSGKTPVVIDSDDLVNAPEATIRAYCDAVGIPFLPEALAWEPGPRKEFVWWEGGSWHNKLNQTAGFKAPKKEDYPAIEDHAWLQEAYDICLPYYEKMYAARLRV